jgi:hypothetical protein
MRDPLRTFRIECMHEHQIMAMGVIPVTTLMVVSNQMTKLMVTDSEMFPGLAVLRVPTPTASRTFPEISANLANGMGAMGGVAGQDSAREVHRGVTLDDICKMRGVKLRKDLVLIPIC